jgi:(E)-4-hydroxy-3-methylbut-2-enyl-diphosphate synthase
VVNGPGEAREADIGIAAGNGKGMIFRNGEIVRRVEEKEIVPALLEEVARWEQENAGKIAAVKPIDQGVEGIGRRKLPVVAGQPQSGR